MLDLNHSCFSAKILLPRDYFNSDTTLGKMLNIALDAFIVDTGLGDDVFNMDFGQHGGLATRGWYKHLWELCTFLNVKIQGNFSRRFRPARKGDVSFMKELSARNKDAKCLGGKGLEIVGRYRKFKKIYFLSEITLCDGATVDPEVLQHSEGKLDWHYAKEKPPRKHLQLWEKAIRLVAPRGNASKPVLQVTMGSFVQQPPRHKGWYKSPHGAIPYKNHSTYWWMFEVHAFSGRSSVVIRSHKTILGSGRRGDATHRRHFCQCKARARQR